MALIKEPLDKAKQRNEELEAAEEAAAQEALGREQEVDRVSEWEERYKLSRSSGKDCLKPYRISCKPHRKHGKAVWTKSVPTMRKPKVKRQTA
ncbi:hypothetical protein NM3164_1369 [Neisseria meningitidis NM3164]|nr:hypothetical protein NM3164_1369 [Neisseria meningitidis NM3164]